MLPQPGPTGDSLGPPEWVAGGNVRAPWRWYIQHLLRSRFSSGNWRSESLLQNHHCFALAVQGKRIPRDGCRNSLVPLMQGAHALFCFCLDHAVHRIIQKPLLGSWASWRWWPFCMSVMGWDPLHFTVFTQQANGAPDARCPKWKWTTLKWFERCGTSNGPQAKPAK